jgi:hypothetical protein
LSRITPSMFHPIGWYMDGEGCAFKTPKASGPGVFGGAE